MESTTVGFRLSNDVWARYSAEAQAQGLTLATYLRRRLEQQDDLCRELADLRRSIDLATTFPASGHSGPPAPPGATLEILLLLRSLVAPQKALVAQKELARRGIEVWS